MSNYAAVRDRVIRSTSLADNLPVGVACHLFELSWEVAKGDESQVGDLYVARVKAYLAAGIAVVPPTPTQTAAVVSAITAQTTPMLKLDTAAIVVIADALGNGTMFDDAARAQVLKELLGEMRRLDISVAVQRST
jgi:hypothetical protein